MYILHFEMLFEAFLPWLSIYRVMRVVSRKQDRFERIRLLIAMDFRVPAGRVFRLCG